jgi:hypothetical protein
MPFLENFDIFKRSSNFKPLNTKILLIPQFLGHRLVCAQAILLFDKPVSKKCGNYIHFVFQRQFGVSEMGLDDGLRNTLADLFNKYIYYPQADLVWPDGHIKNLTTKNITFKLTSVVECRV